jgi:NADH-quinone oxidoreductase subunit M
LILLSTFSVNSTLTVIASLGLVFSALYSLRMMQKVFLGQPTATGPLKDFSGRELIIMAALSISIVALGLYPQPVMETVKGFVQQIVANVQM